MHDDECVMEFLLSDRIATTITPSQGSARLRLTSCSDCIACTYMMGPPWQHSVVGMFWKNAFMQFFVGMTCVRGRCLETGLHGRGTLTHPRFISHTNVTNDSTHVAETGLTSVLLARKPGTKCVKPVWYLLAISADIGAVCSTLETDQLCDVTPSNRHC